MNGIRIILPLGIGLQFKGNDGNAVKEDYQVDAFVITCPNFFCHGKDVLAVIFQQFLIETGSWLGVHQVQMLVSNVKAMLQSRNQVTVFTIEFLIEVIEQGFLKVTLVHLTKRLNLLGLGCRKELNQQLTIDGVPTVEIGVGAYPIAVIVLKIVKDASLVIVSFVDGKLHRDPSLFLKQVV